MDLGELSTGIESPLIPVLLWSLLGILVVVAVTVTIAGARRGRRRRAVVVIGTTLLLLSVGIAAVIASRYDIATMIDRDLCPPAPDGVGYMGFYVLLTESEPMDPYQQCLALQYRVAAGALGSYALAVAVGSVAQLRASRIRSA